jgi:nitrite reductase (NADH) small subunit
MSSDTHRWIRTVRCEDIPLREARSVRLSGRDIAIFNLGDRFLAVDNRCPHKGGPLAEGIVSGKTVICPLHSRKVCLETGDVLNSPDASRCVETFRTRVEDGVVSLELPIKPAATRETPGLCLEEGGEAHGLDQIRSSRVQPTCQ